LNCKHEKKTTPNAKIENIIDLNNLEKWPELQILIIPFLVIIIEILKVLIKNLNSQNNSLE
jgi:hypothetical protein